MTRNLKVLGKLFHNCIVEVFISVFFTITTHKSQPIITFCAGTTEYDLYKLQKPFIS